MISYKTGQTLRLPVRLYDQNGAPKPGVNFAVISVTVEKADGTLIDFAPDNTQWVETTQGAFGLMGKYDLILPSTFADQQGSLTYAVATVGTVGYIGVVKLVINEESDTKTLVDDLHDVAIGSWEIKTTGPDANKMILYKADGVTVFKKFDLFDKNGSPTTSSVFKRSPE